MEIKINSQKEIFRPPHKLGEKDTQFFGEQCAKLAKLGFTRKSDKSHYASAIVVVKKKDVVLSSIVSRSQKTTL